MHRAIALAGLISIASCATTGTGSVGAGIEIKRGGGGDAAKRTTPAEVVVSFADGSPAAGVKIRAIDTAERVYDLITNADGRANIAVWSEAMSLWRVGMADGSWKSIPPCRGYKADGKTAGVRFACTVPQGGDK